jgi:tRNA-modifying protein YgfZ
MAQHSTMVSPTSAAAYDAARRRAAFVDRSDRGRIVVSGTDRASYLQGLLTNDVVALEAGRGCYAAYLTAQGRMIADMQVYELGDVILLTLAGDVKDAVIAKLDQFIFTEDVQLGDVTATFVQIAVVGPSAPQIVSSALGGSIDSAVLTGLPADGNVRVPWTGGAVIVARIADAGVPGFDLFVEREQAAALRGALAANDVPELDAATAETLRIEAGVPLFHRDMDEETIPLEAGIEARAISFTKGCYVGQEVIIRVLHRGHGRVARKLVGIAFDGAEAPASGSRIESAGRDAGEVTSSTFSPALQRAIALGYVHRDFVAPGTTVTVAGVAGTVTALPFVEGVM